MGLFGKQDNTNIAEKYKTEINDFLVQGEEVEGIYPLIIDFLCITNKRIIFVDKVISLKEPKTTTYSVPYKNIMSVGLEKNLKAVALTDGLSIITLGAVYNLRFTNLVDIKDIYNQIVRKII